MNPQNNNFRINTRNNTLQIAKREYPPQCVFFCLGDVGKWLSGGDVPRRRRRKQVFMTYLLHQVFRAYTRHDDVN